MIEVNELRKSLDTSNMHGAILGFPQQISDSFSIMENWVAQNDYKNIQQILVLGMGGSAIGGDVVRVLIQSECTIPMIVNRSYNIPNWVNKNTLVIASSYSGNTEETLSALRQCIGANAQILSITTGGELLKISNENNFDSVILPTGLQPRAALGVSASILLLSLQKLQIVNNSIIEDLHHSIDVLSDLGKELSNCDDENPAMILANEIHSMCPIIYGSEDLTWVAALRFRGQLEENSKMLAFHHHIPEQNHNEIEGWSCHTHLLDSKCIVWLKDEDDHPRSLKRMDISSQLLTGNVGKQIEIQETGPSPLVRLFKMIHFTDWVSYYAALLNEVDPTPVDRITQLKTELAKG